MAGKLKPILDKIRAKIPVGLSTRSAAGARRGVSSLKIVAIGLSSLVFSLALTGVVWFWIHPLNSYRPFVANYLREKLGADEFRLGDLSWKFSLRHLSIGVKADELSFRRAGLLHRFQSSHLEVSLIPLKALTGKLPFNVESFGGTVAFKATGPAVPVAESDAPVGPAVDPVADWLKRTSVSFHLKDIAVSVDPRLFSRAEAEDASLFFEIKEISGSIDGIPGPFRATLVSQLDFDWGGGTGQLLGPASFELSGNFQTIENRALGARIDSFHADLSKTRIAAAGIVEKRIDQSLEFESRVQVVFDDKFLISKIELNDAQIQYEELPLSANVGIDFRKQELALSWDSGRREVKQLRFPVRKISGLPFRGFFESTGSLKVSRRADPQVAAKLALNNFRLNLKDLVKADYIDPESRGEVLFSVVSEISYKDRKLSSPRFELQADAHTAQIEVQGGRYVKPKGDELAMLLKGKIENEIFEVEKAAARVNNLDFDSRFTIDRFNTFFHGEDGATIKAEFRTNPVNLTEWSSYLPWFRKIPLQGRMEGVGTFEGPVRRGEIDWSDYSWRIDRFSLAQVRGSFERQGMESLGLKTENWSLAGPFAVDVLFQGRGRGPVIQKAYFISMLDMNGLDVRYGDANRTTFHKPSGQNFSIDVAAEQTQNRLAIRRGTVKLFDNSILLGGKVTQGSKRNSINLRLDKPLRLENWRPYFGALPEGFPSLGKVSFEGKLGFGTGGDYEQSLDWSQFGFDGYVLLEDVALNTWPFAQPVKNITGGIWVEGKRVLYPNLRFSVLDSRFSVSGESSLVAGKGNEGNLSMLFGGKTPWNVSAQVEVDRWREGLLGQPAKGADQTSPSQAPSEEDFLEALRRFASSPRAQKSKLNVRFRARDAGEGKSRSRNLTTIVKWDNGRLNADPLSARLFGGHFKGSFTYDAQPYYARKDPPQVAFAGTLERLRLGSLASLYIPSFAEKLDGEFSGDVRLAADGFDVDTLRETARGRVQGRADAFRFEPFSVVDRGVRVLIRSSDATDYVSSGSNPDKCLAGAQTADFDLNLSRGALVVQKFNLSSDTKTRMSALGMVQADGKLEVRGKLLPGPQCLVARASACLEEKVMTFTLGDTIAKPKLALDVETLGRRIASCLSDKVEDEVRAAIEDEARPSSSARQKEKALRDRLLKSIQGKKSSR